MGLVRQIRSGSSRLGGPVRAVVDVLARGARLDASTGRVAGKPQAKRHRVAHFELGQIPEHAVELKAAANFLVANYGRQKIISMPRAVPKIAIFEEAARTLDIPGGTKMIQEYYRQMRKFGCNILAVIQQYDIIKESAVRGATIGNSKMLSTVGLNEVERKTVGSDSGLFWRHIRRWCVASLAIGLYSTPDTDSSTLDRLRRAPHMIVALLRPT
jgi:hypothetical protein